MGDKLCSNVEGIFFEGVEEEYKYFTGMETGDPKRYDGFSFGTKIFLIPLEDYLLHFETFFFMDIFYINLWKICRLANV